MSAVLVDFWNELHPSKQRMPRRIAPLKWLNSRLTSLSESTGFIGEPQESISAMQKALESLQAAIDQKYPDNDLGFCSIIHRQREYTESTQEKLAQPLDTKQADNKPAQRLAGITNIDDALAQIEKDRRIPPAVLPQVIRSTNDYARQLGDHLLALNITDERGYQLHRVSCWNTLLQLPPIDDNKITQILCIVPPEKISEYSSAIDGKQYTAVLPQIENAASQSPFWLDGHYMVVRCLEGIEAITAASAMKHALAQFLHRFPDLTMYKFKGGVPFASPKTLLWLESLQDLAFSSTPNSIGNISSSYTSVHDDEERLQQAISTGLENNFQAGLEHLGTVPSGKNRSFIKNSITRARYCFAIGQKNAARRIAEGTFNMLKQWDMLDWEPDLSASLISILISTSSNLRNKEGAEEIYTLLHIYNLEAAVNKFSHLDNL